MKNNNETKKEDKWVPFLWYTEPQNFAYWVNRETTERNIDDSLYRVYIKLHKDDHLSVVEYVCAERIDNDVIHICTRIVSKRIKLSFSDEERCSKTFNDVAELLHIMNTRTDNLPGRTMRIFNMVKSIIEGKPIQIKRNNYSTTTDTRQPLLKGEKRPEDEVMKIDLLK